MKKFLFYISIGVSDRKIFLLLFTFISLAGINNTSAQLRIAPARQDTVKQSISLHSEDNQVIDATTVPATQYLNGNVMVYHNGTFMYCDNAVLKGNMLKMYTNVVMLQNDTIRIFADSLVYNGDVGVAFLYGEIILENGNKKLTTTYLEYDVRNKIGYYNQNARLEDGKSILTSKRGRYLLNDKIAFFGGNVKIDGENFSLVSDSIGYHTDTQITDYHAPVRIMKDTLEIYSLGGWFDMDDKLGDFIGDAQYQSGNSRARADTISYDGNSDIIILKSVNERSVYISETDTAYAFEIYYDKTAETYKLTGDGYYKNEKNEVKGEKVSYNKKTESFKVSGRSYVSDPPTIIEADEIDYDKLLKNGKADGNVIWRDTTAKTTVFADHIIYVGEENRMKATNDSGRPLFTTVIDQDTLYLRADTLKSFRVIKELRLTKAEMDKLKEKVLLSDSIKMDTIIVETSEIEIPEMVKVKIIPEIMNSDTSKLKTIIPAPKINPEETNSDSTSLVLNEIDSIDKEIFIVMDTTDYFIGDNNVRLYKNGLQSVCDSLTYIITDSMFVLSGIPFVWSDSTQISGDTIMIFMENKKVSKLTSAANALILTTEDLIFFNQIRGKTLVSKFEDGKVRRMDIDGNAEAIYYLLDDDKAYIGVNRTECSNMTFWFNEDKITDIHFYKDPASKVIPMRKADHEGLKVKGFIWNAEKRPSSEADL
ncbi:MAG: hypothetical protein IPM42_05970 [Saprospiraceae bacterium]|nr:hypothetical protein [Saprospiraceae bacterium]